MQSALRLVAGAPGVRRDPTDPRWWDEHPDVLSPAGVYVTDETALNLPIVIDCLNVLSQPIASLPKRVYRRTRDADGKPAREPVDNHPIADLMRAKPNNTMTGYEFFAFMQWNLAWYRNAFAEILPGPRGAVDQLIPIHPSRVTVQKQRDGSALYHVDEPGNRRVLTPDEIWHLRAAPFDKDALCGISMRITGQEALGAALAVQRYGARFFKNNATSGGVIEHPSSFKDKEQRRSFIEAWRAASTGDNAHKDRVLEFGMKYTPGKVNNDEAQFLETRKEADLDIARMWRIPPHKVGHLERATFSNIEQQSIEFVVDTLLPWITLWEQAISRDLIVGDQTYFVEFNVSGLLRGDIKSRFEAYTQGIQNGWLSPNDVRRLENLNPIPGGDQYWRPLNMAPLDAPYETAGAGTREALAELKQILQEKERADEPAD
ncbi:phage portal protein [Marinicauda algicola]|nr:phage portal protein [Marinicauda algicola]